METFYTIEDLVEQGILSEEEKSLYHLYIKYMDESVNLVDAKPAYLKDFDPKVILWLVACKPNMDKILKKIETFLDERKCIQICGGEEYLDYPDNDMIFEYSSRWECEENDNPRIFSAWKDLCDFLDEISSLNK